MTETVTSPRYHTSTSRPSRPTTTSANLPTNNSGSIGQNMPQYFSPRSSTPQNPNAPTAKSPSPNYFGFQSNDSNSYLNDVPQHAKSNWSPPSSTVRSTAAASPSVVPLDQNPEYEAFRKQSEGKQSFNLGGMGHNFKVSEPPARPGHGRTASRQEATKEAMRHGQSLDPNSEISRSPKRVLSPGSMILPEGARRGSPANLPKREMEHTFPKSQVPAIDSQPRLSLPLDKPPGSRNPAQKPRAETLPVSTGGEPEPWATSQHIINIMESKGEEVLILDLRVSTQYAKSHISGALNLCIPTTLLKRPSFNVQKLAETFKDERQRRKFEDWQNTSYIVVYDSASADMKDGQICANTLKKFMSEGYDGTLYIIKGGFAEFSKRFPSYVEDGLNPSANDSKLGVEGDGPKVAPVVGGCPMPATSNAANPFFGNIRQNMDLIGGVGQMALKHPSNASQSAEREFPKWLRKAADGMDEGKQVSNKFEAIERREKKRMEDALSGHVSWGSSPKKQTPGKNVQIAGIEKGNKNRYNNIWPFEHSRVKLQGVPSSGCDYFNASHVKAAWSNKHYISTQAPIPGTFNDFWNVVWQQDVRVIVMLTAEKEGAQVKAHNYWESRQFGPLRLDFLSEKRASIEPSRIHRHKQRPSLPKRSSTGPQVPGTALGSREEKNSDEPYVIVRRFTLSHERHPFEPMREITHLQYGTWPDFGAPAHPAHVLGLVEQVDAVVRSTGKTHSSSEPEPPNKRPVLVHCSAGCGRTGTFCTVDSVIDMLKRQRASRTIREATPMDIDSPAPPSRSSGSKERQGAGFFESQFQDAGEGIDGSWIHREDLDLVEKTVEDLRQQRISMVQSLRQYVLCYESVMEWLVQQHQDHMHAARSSTY